jgi:hypothetical protein
LESATAQPNEIAGFTLRHPQVSVNIALHATKIAKQAGFVALETLAISPDLKPPSGWRALVGALNTLAIMVSEGSQNAPCQIRHGFLVRASDVRGSQHALGYLSCSQRFGRGPERVNGAAVDRAPLEPWVGLAALHGDAPQVERRVAPTYEVAARPDRVLTS